MKPVEEIEISYKRKIYDRRYLSGVDPLTDDYVLKTVLAEIALNLQCELSEGKTHGSQYTGRAPVNKSDPDGAADLSITTITVRRISEA